MIGERTVVQEALPPPGRHHHKPADQASCNGRENQAAAPVPNAKESQSGS
jgi:hypothetical protein